MSASELNQSSKATWMKTIFSLHGKEKSIPDDGQSEITLIQRSEQSSDSQPYKTALPPKNFNGRHSKFRKLKPWLAD
ncbi:hypothetical protein N7509_003058 [Penicillium cosmopolitanum]|uniref:Uncharacterized protein n=1 Tax=Penicillium cosmopolitanum TaxID=1131564 RepID=A0A9W9W4E6_9EURO|nr:uncharacterized protein N7509_003058 [Penicillium cosmopolitanum]KAJ5403187.1 hypothetical protein N7509_003058 [Penicillium cosmopolitanum]